MAENIPIRPKRNEPRPIRIVESPRAPKHLSAESRKLWNDVVKAWILGPDGLAILRGALESWDSYQACREEVKRDGQTFRTDSGQIRQHPAAKLSADYFTAFRQAMRQLGLDPEQG